MTRHAPRSVDLDSLDRSDESGRFVIPVRPPVPMAKAPSRVESFWPAQLEQPAAVERAELIIEDLSLRLDNPFARSSLQPPPAKPFPTRQVLTCVAAFATAIVAGAYLATRPAGHSVEVAGTRTPATRVETRPAAVASPTMPATVAAARPVLTMAVAVAAPAMELVEVAPTSVAASGAVKQPWVARTPAAGKTVQPPAPPMKTAAPDATPVPAAQVEVAAPVGSGEAVPAVAEALVTAPVTTPTSEDLEALPEAPTRDEIKAAFEALRPELTTCAAGSQGTALLHVTITGPTGRATYSIVEGAFAGTPEGSCMARAARVVSFPRFAQPTLKASYPFAL
jgi:hypothetical protein